MAPRANAIMRKFGIKYSMLHPRSVEVRSAFCKVRERTEWEDVLDDWYGTDGPGQHPDGNWHKAQGSCEN